MTVFALYLDESAINDHFLVIAGFVAPEDQWTEFNSRWSNILSDWDIPYLRLKELVNSTATKYRHLDPDDRLDIMAEAAEAIWSTASFSVMTAISPREYKSLTDNSFRGRYGSAYTYSINVLIAATVLSLDDSLDSQLLESRHTLDVLLENGHTSEREAVSQIQHLKEQIQPVPVDKLRQDGIEAIEMKRDPLRQIRVDLRRIGVGTKLEATMYPLQAADLLASSTTREMTRRDDGSLSVIMNAVEAKVPYKGIMLDKDYILKSVKRMSEYEKEKKEQREDIWALKKYYDQYGILTTELPFGVLLDPSAMTESQRAKFNLGLDI